MTRLAITSPTLNTVPFNDVVFEGDESRTATRSGSMSPVAKSPIVDFLIEKGIVHSENRARIFIACLTIVVFIVTGWIFRDSLVEEQGRPYSDLSPAERAALPIQQRLMLDQIEADRNEAILAPQPEQTK